LEVLTKFPKQTGTNRLAWFENLMTIGVLGLVVWLVGAWLVSARASHLGLVYALLPIFLVPTLWASGKLNNLLWLKRTNLRGEGDRFMAYIAVVGPAFVVAYVVASLAATPVTGALNSIQPPVTSPTPSHSASPSPHPSTTPT